MAKKCFTFPASWAQLLPYNNIWYVFFPYFAQLSANVFAVCSLCYISLFGWIFFLSFGESIWVLIFSALSLKMSLLVLPKHKLSSQVTGVKVYCLSTTCSKLVILQINSPFWCLDWDTGVWFPDDDDDDDDVSPPYCRMFEDKELCLFSIKRCCMFSQTTYPSKRLKEEILLPFYSVVRKKRQVYFGRVSSVLCHIQTHLPHLSTT